VIVFIVPKNSGLSICKEIAKEYSGEIIEVRGEDIPFIVSSLIKSNKIAIGITGEDLFREFMLENKNTGIAIIEKIPWKDDNCIFGKPTLCLMGSKGKRLEDMPKRLRVCINKKYSKISKKYLSRLEDKGFSFEKLYLSGATEQTFVNKLADLVIEIVYSGKSAEENGLEVYDKIFSSDIVVIGKKMEIDINNLDFSKGNGLIPTIVKDENGKVLMLAYSSKESLLKALETRKGVYFSRSRDKIWIKGETSGNTQELLEIKTDCDRDALLFVVKQNGEDGACCLKRYSCFEEDKEKKDFDLEALYDKIKQRIDSNDEKSYTRKLIADSELLKRKLIEEAAEVITAKDRGELIWECSDLIYFLFVIMAKEGITIRDIEKENERRNEE